MTMIKITLTLFLSFSMFASEAGRKRSKKPKQQALGSFTSMLSDVGGGGSCTWTPPRLNPGENPDAHVLTRRLIGYNQDSPIYESCAQAQRRVQKEWTDRNFQGQVRHDPQPLPAPAPVLPEPVVAPNDHILLPSGSSQIPYNCEIRHGTVYCSSCSETIDPLLHEVKRCNSDSDCVVVPGGGCCDSHVVHKQQKGKYLAALKRTREMHALQRARQPNGVHRSCSCRPTIRHAGCSADKRCYLKNQVLHDPYSYSGGGESEATQ